LNEEALKAYLKNEFRDVSHLEIRKLGSGVQGSGYAVEIKTEEGIKSYVIKGPGPGRIRARLSIRQGIRFLLDLDEYKNLPGHVKALDVLAEMEDGSIKSIGGGMEYYLLMEQVEGRDYFNDLSEFAGKDKLETQDIGKIKAMASYLAEIHSVRRDSRTLYWRKLRDTVGHGECLMGVFDTYPDGTVPYEEITDVIKKSVDWIYRLKPGYGRLAQIHGDFHPGNIWFKDNADFILLDRSRGPWGEPADDVTALAINYIFFSVKKFGDVRGAYLEGLNLFFEEYKKTSGDTEITEVVAPFFAFRAAVVANPVFYPDLSAEARKKSLQVLRTVSCRWISFEALRVNEYIAGDA